MKKIKFSGTVENKKGLWTYEFYITMALIVNSSGAITISSSLVVIDIADETDRLKWLWENRAKVKRVKDEDGLINIKVYIKSKNRWKHAASFTQRKI